MITPSTPVWRVKGGTCWQYPLSPVHTSTIETLKKKKKNTGPFGIIFSFARKSKTKSQPHRVSPKRRSTVRFAPPSPTQLLRQLLTLSQISMPLTLCNFQRPYEMSLGSMPFLSRHIL